MKTIDLSQIAEVKLSYMSKVKASDRPKINSSADAFRIIYETWDHDSIEHIEEFKLLLLNRSNKALGITTISKGGISGTITDVRVILQYAIKANASSIIIAHNHPSGNLEPSEADRRITQKIKDAAEIMEISVLDHLLIVPQKEYYSFADKVWIL